MNPAMTVATVNVRKQVKYIFPRQVAEYFSDKKCEKYSAFLIYTGKNYISLAEKKYNINSTK